MNQPKYQIGDRFENDDEEENQPDWKAMEEFGQCPYCYSCLEYSLVSNGDNAYCEMCGMDL